MKILLIMQLEEETINKENDEIFSGLFEVGPKRG